MTRIINFIAFSFFVGQKILNRNNCTQLFWVANNPLFVQNKQKIKSESKKVRPET